VSGANGSRCGEAAASARCDYGAWTVAGVDAHPPSQFGFEGHRGPRMTFTIVDGLLTLLDLFVDCFERLRGNRTRRNRRRDRKPPPPAT
jgi:hypothetical protein